MTDTSHILSRREFVKASAAAAAVAALPGAAFAAAPDKGADTSADKSAVLAEIPKMHAANIRRLQEWIALPSIAAENRNYPQGPEHMAQLARAAGFMDVKIMPTSGKAGVIGRIDAGARTTVGIYFMYDVKQFVPQEWSSPPLEGRNVRGEDESRGDDQEHDRAPVRRVEVDSRNDRRQHSANDKGQDRREQGRRYPAARGASAGAAAGPWPRI